VSAIADAREGEPRWPISVEVPVAWGDMDALRHVNNAVYARWLESARIAYFLRVEMLGLQGDPSVGPILARQTIDFRRPVEFPDVVTIDARVARLGTTSLELRYRVRSRAQSAIVAEGESIVVLFDFAQGTKRELPASLRAAIAAVESLGSSARADG
jgi:acyl-CoA thioester hydrolase